MGNTQLGGVLRYIRQLVGAEAAGDRTDGQLLDAFVRNQDPDAFDALVSRYASLVWGVCRRHLRDEHEAEDAFQATFLVLVRKAAALDRRGSLANWLYTVAYHLTVRARQQSARRRLQEKEAADMLTPEADSSRWELSTVVDEELHQLPDKYRQPLVLCYLHGKTNEEAAQELGYPAGSMSRHLTRGRELLRQRLSGRGVAVPSAVLTASMAATANAVVPPAAIRSTIEAGLVYAAGQSAAILSPSAVELAEGLLKVPAASKLKIAVALALALSLTGTGSVLVYRNLHDTAPLPTTPEASSLQVAAPVLIGPADGGLANTVDRIVDAWQPTKEERRIDEIGWAKDLRDARRLAKEHNRPIFLLVHEGDLATGRCCAGAAHSRASALSNDRVIALLNHCFIPVAISNQDYARDGKAPAEEKTERQRIQTEASQKGILGGVSWVYVLDAAGRPVASLHGCTAAVGSQLLALLECYEPDPGAEKGVPVIAPQPLSRPPQVKADALVLHLTARYLKKQGAALVPFQTKLGSDKAGGWHDYPAENWVVLERADWSKLLPAEAPKVGTEWLLDDSVTQRLFQHFYPQTEQNDLSRNRIESGCIKATVVSAQAGIVRARLDGTLHMKHPHVASSSDDSFVDATIVGYLDFDLGRQHIRSLRLCTPEATYGAEPFGVAVRSVLSPTPH